jgi:DNA-binding beta-propeller fold protein YncE
VGVSGSADGTGSLARFYWPLGVAVGSAGNVYVADTYNHRVSKGTPHVVGDINGEEHVDAADLLILAGSFGKCEGDAAYDSRCDLNGDHCVDVSDVLILARNWGVQRTAVSCPLSVVIGDDNGRACCRRSHSSAAAALHWPPVGGTGGTDDQAPEGCRAAGLPP